MHFLVTGGGGFIGSNLVEELLKSGQTVRVLDNFSTGKRENLRPFISDFELIEGDIRSYHVTDRAVRGTEIILHQAALPSVPRSINDPITSNEVNVVGTLNILEAARSHGVRRIVYASSSSVYGDNPMLPKVETMTPKPLSPYAVSKLAGEHYCRIFSELYGIETVALRYFNVFGPRQDPNSQYSAVIPRFINAMLNGTSPMIYGDGEQSRDFTYVSNVVRANMLAATEADAVGKAMNCATHGQITLNDLVDNLNGILETDIKAQYADTRPGDIKHSYADIHLLQSATGYSPITDFASGLHKTVRYYREQPNMPASFTS
ncbi:MAG: SDR family oxidoreductase [Bacteroidetes bacterium]|nr:SDR family oxidoreductase [Bacteroidota bacterium]